MKRIALLIATNFAVLMLLGLVIQVFGIDDWLARRGQNYEALLVLSAIFGFGGAFISLLMSKWMAKMAMGVKVITQPASEAESWLVETVRSHARQAGIGMPEVGVFQSPDPNAFATGASRNSALVAVSTGLLANMRRDEVAAVLGHEVAHVANGDMVTLTLLQGVLNTFVIFLARIIGGLVDSAMRGNNENRGPGFGYYITTIAAQMVLGLFAGMIVAAYSRRREYRDRPRRVDDAATLGLHEVRDGGDVEPVDEHVGRGTERHARRQPPPERDGDRQRQQQLHGPPDRGEREEATAAHRPANATSCCTQNSTRALHVATAVRSGTVRRLLLVQLASSQRRWSGSTSARTRRSGVTRVSFFQRSTPSQSTRSTRPDSNVSAIVTGNDTPPVRRAITVDAYGSSRELEVSFTSVPAPRRPSGFSRRNEDTAEIS